MNITEQQVRKQPQRNAEWYEIGERLEKSQNEALREFDEKWKRGIVSRCRNSTEKKEEPEISSV